MISQAHASGAGEAGHTLSAAGRTFAVTPMRVRSGEKGRAGSTRPVGVGITFGSISKEYTLGGSRRPHIPLTLALHPSAITVVK
jgi:hypothetical protein